MKRVFVILMVNILLTCSVTVFAGEEAEEDTANDVVLYDAAADEDTYVEDTTILYTDNLSDGEAGSGTIEDIYKYWETNGYPEDISFAYEAGGEMIDEDTSYSWWEIGVVGADEERKQEILELVAPNCLVTFVECQYTHTQREAAYEKILGLEDENILDVILSLNTELIIVVVREDVLEEYAAVFENVGEWGVIISVTDQTAVVEDLAGEATIQPDGDMDRGMSVMPFEGEEQDAVLAGGAIDQGNLYGNNSYWWFTIAIIVLFVLILFAVLQNRLHFLPVKQTVNGTIIVDSAPVSRKETVEAVKNSTAKPREELFQKMKEEIKKS